MKIHLIFSLIPKDSSMLGIRVRFFEAMRHVVEAEVKNKETSAFSGEAFIWSIYGAFCSFGNDEIDYDTLLDYLPKCYKLLTIQF